MHFCACWFARLAGGLGGVKTNAGGSICQGVWGTEHFSQSLPLSLFDRGSRGELIKNP